MSVIIVITLTSFILSLIIVFIDFKYNKIEDEIKEILDLLPGYNCGMCGHNTCPGMTQAMLINPMEFEKCRPMKPYQKEEMLAYLRKKKKVV
jgi:Na+-translocating ferredoxin:NAD+ oxidoreductase subunit B